MEKFEECTYEIMKHYGNGVKRINVFLSKDLSVWNVIDFFCSLEPNKSFYVWEDHQIINIGDNKQLNEDLETFFEHRGAFLSENDVVFLVGKNAKERKQFGELLGSNASAIVITFNIPALSEESDKELKALGIDTQCVNVKTNARYSNNRVALALTCSDKPYLIYDLESIFDIRDIGMAKYEEQKKLREQLDDDKKILSKKVNALLNSFKNHDLNPQLIATNEKNCILLLELIQFLKNIIDRIELEQNGIVEQFLIIKRIKENNKKDLQSNNEQRKKDARKRIVDAIADSANRLTRNVITVDIYEEIEVEIKEALSQNVWNKLMQESKRYLISAVASYKMLERYHNNSERESIDFSGVCILMSKAIEGELFSRVYKDYREYIYSKKGVSYSKWPSGMLKKDALSPREDHEVTLGTIPYILGYKGNNQENKKTSREMFEEYAVEKLYDRGIGRAKVKAYVKKISEIVDKINEKFRRDAAHINGIDYATATQCKDYIIYVEKALKEILGKMRC